MRKNEDYHTVSVQYVDVSCRLSAKQMTEKVVQGVYERSPDT